MLSHENQVLLTKPAASGVAAFLLNRYMNSRPMDESVAFGGSTALGVLIADATAKRMHGTAVERSLEQRLLEVGVTSGIAYGTSRYFFNNTLNMREVGTIVAAEVVGEYVALSFLGLA